MICFRPLHLSTSTIIKTNIVVNTFVSISTASISSFLSKTQTCIECQIQNFKVDDWRDNLLYRCCLLTKYVYKSMLKPKLDENVSTF